MPRGSLVIVGTGISALLHLTPEAGEQIRTADELLYLVDDPLAEAHLTTLRPDAVALAGQFTEGVPRREVYGRLVDRILAGVRQGRCVCAAFSGHPAVLVDPAHAAVRLAREEGFPARILPGISAEACLFADLGVDPGARGCQSYEATDFLIRPRLFDTSTALVLWQAAALGDLSVRRSDRPNEHLGALAEALAARYGPGHPAIVYEAASSPGAAPVITHTTVSTLDAAGVTARSLLYVPPLPPPPAEGAMLERLGMAQGRDRRKSARSRDLTR